MTRPAWLRGKKAWFAGALAALLLLYGCFTTWNLITGYKMTTTLAAQPHQTVCMGRFLIDLPEHALPAGTGWRYAYQGHEFGIESGVTLEQYNDALKKRIAELQAVKTYGKYQEVLFAGHQQLTSPANAHIVLRWRDARRPEAGAYSESYLWLDGKQFLSKEPDSIDKPDIPKFAADMTNFFSRILPLKPKEIPDGSGYCMEDSWIPDQAGKMNDWERISLEFGLNGHPDVRFTVSARLDSTAPETLLAREDAHPVPLEERWRYHYLRKGERTLAHGFKGQEVTARVLDTVGGLMVGPEWEGYFEVPHQGTGTVLSITAQSGWSPRGRVSASLSEGEMLALWDFVLNSVRLRPTPDASKPAPRKTGPVPPQTALGALIKTGESCPQSGIWESSVGAERLLLRAGESVPSATVSVKLSLMQKLRGEPGHAYAPTTWRLREYTDNGGKPLA